MEQRVQEKPEASEPSAIFNALVKPVRKLIVFVIGMTVLLIGVAMIVLPGPAFVVIPVGLAILATEFVWARRWLNYIKRQAQEVAEWSSKSKS
jgi:tellurite resistance protein TerC